MPYPETNTPKKTYKIAIIEDEVAIQLMYKLKLEREGFKVEIAGDGISGLKLINKFRPDLILLDLRMPRMDGFEMLKKLRTTKLGSRIKVIILTNISKNEAPKDLQFFDVKRYIVKAYYTPSQIISIINDVI